MSQPLLLKCTCCGYAEAFIDADEAFEKGWDCPPHFSVIACDLCPSVCAMGIVSHEKAHALWAKEGRPSEWSLDRCSADGVIDNPTELRRAQTAMRKIKSVLKALRRKEKGR